MSKEKLSIVVDEIWEYLHLLDANKYELIVRKIHKFDSARDYNNEIHIFYKPKTVEKWGEVYPKKILLYRRSDLIMYNTIKFFNINVPRYFFASSILGITSMLEDGARYLLRADLAARSLGQMFITKDKLNQIYHDSEKLTNIEFNNKHIKDIGKAYGDEETYKLYNQLKSVDVYVQEVIDFISEYRILMFNSNFDKYNFIIEKREGYQIESKEERKHSVLYTSNDTKVPNYFKLIMNQLFKLIKYFNAPCMSFDVYLIGCNINDPDKTKGGFQSKHWGLFEYSFEFGIDYPEHSLELADFVNIGMGVSCSVLNNSILSDIK